MVFPCQVLQHRMAKFFAQPAGPGQFLRDAAFLDTHLEQPNFVSRALPRVKTGSGAAAHETGTDPKSAAPGGKRMGRLGYGGMAELSRGYSPMLCGRAAPGRLTTLPWRCTGAGRRRMRSMSLACASCCSSSPL